MPAVTAYNTQNIADIGGFHAYKVIVFIIICLIIIYHLIIALIAYHTLHVKSGFFFTWRQYIIAVLSVLLQLGVFFRDTLMYEKETIIHAIIHVLCFVFAAAIPIISF